MFTATLTRNEQCFLAAVRISMPQYRTASDQFLVNKFEKRFKPVVEEIEVFFESYSISLWNQALTIELMASALKCLGEFVENSLYLSNTPKDLANSVSFLKIAIDKKYPGCFKFGLLPFYLCPSYISHPETVRQT